MTKTIESPAAVKIGSSRQVVIPKKIHDQLGLVPGDYLQVELAAGKVVFTPKTLVDKRIAARLAEGLDDVRHGRVSRKFRSAAAAVRSLRGSGTQRRG